MLPSSNSITRAAKAIFHRMFRNTPHCAVKNHGLVLLQANDTYILVRDYFANPFGGFEAVHGSLTALGRFGEDDVDLRFERQRSFSCVVRNHWGRTETLGIISYSPPTTSISVSMSNCAFSVRVRFVCNCWLMSYRTPTSIGPGFPQLRFAVLPYTPNNIHGPQIRKWLRFMLRYSIDMPRSNFQSDFNYLESASRNVHQHFSPCQKLLNLAILP